MDRGLQHMTEVPVIGRACSHVGRGIKVVVNICPNLPTCACSLFVGVHTSIFNFSSDCHDMQDMGCRSRNDAYAAGR